MKSRIVIYLFILVSCFIIFNTAGRWKGWVFKYDKSGYHVYLPSIFIYNDVTDLDFYKEIDEYYRPADDIKYYGFNKVENGNKVNKYSIGVAVFETPFFLAAHALNKIIFKERPDGYSTPYQFGAVFSNLFWAVMGLFVLRRLLRRYFSDTITAITLLLIAFGTNYYNYVVFFPGMTHTYSFTLFAFVLLQTDNLYTRNKLNSFYWLAAALGLIVITRSTNLLVGLIPLLWGVNSLSKLSERGLFFIKNIKYIIGSTIIFLAVAMIQMSYWKYVAGQWFYDGYINEGFIWTEPAIRKGLFGFQKGWFIYTPMALFAIAGLYSMRNRFKEHIPAIAIFMTINIYVIFCWWNWWYGGCFSSRPMVESMGILAMPLAAFMEQVSKKRIFIIIPIALICTFFIFLNMFQSYQSYNTTIHWDRMSRIYYFKVFLKTHASEDDRLYLMSEHDFYEQSLHRQEQVTDKD